MNNFVFSSEASDISVTYNLSDISGGRGRLQIGETFVDISENDRVSAVVVGRQSVLALIEDPNTVSLPFYYYDEPIRGNIFAYDLSARQLWQIGDIVDMPIHSPFIGVYILSEKHRQFYKTLFALELDDSHEYCDAVSTRDEHYIIDLTDNKFVKRSVYKS